MIAMVPVFFRGFALSCFRDGKKGRRKNRPSRSSLRAPWLLVADTYYCGVSPGISRRGFFRIIACARLNAMSTKVDEEPNRHSGCLVGSVVVVIVCLTGLAMLIPAVNAAREAANRASCVGNYKLSALGMLNHESAKHHFPPAYVVDANGQPGLSWRVLILPYLEKKSLYEQFHFDEQWNSPHNIALGPLAPCGMDPRRCAYHCVSEGGNHLEVSQVVITGKGTMFDGPTPIRMKDITDGSSNTIMIGEMSFSGIYWSDPRDLNFDEMPLTINDSVQVSLRSVHRGMANIAFADGSVHQISEKIDPEVLKSLITVAGGEQIDASMY